MIVSKSIKFDSAHFLPHYEGKCSRMHGHTWKVEIAVEGNLEDGMVIDFALLKRFLEAIKGELDHTILNHVIKNPTAENICLFVKERFDSWKFSRDIKLKWVKVWESEDSYALLS